MQEKQNDFTKNSMAYNITEFSYSYDHSTVDKCFI